MGTHPSLTTDEGRQEIALRATLHEYAPADVNTDQAWATIVSQRLFVNNPSPLRSKLPTFLSWHSSAQKHPAPLKGRLIVTAIACVAILVAGINVLFPFLPGSQGTADAQQYQQVGLSQSSSGLTMTVEKAYAGNKGTIIAYELQPPADLTKLLKNANRVVAGPSVILEESHIYSKAEPQFKFTVKDHNEELQLSQVTNGCATIKQYNWPIKCVLMLGAFQPPANVNKLTIVLDITGMTIGKFQNSALIQKDISGHWHFQFTVPFHYEKSLPSLPYPIDQLSPVSPSK